MTWQRPTRTPAAASRWPCACAPAAVCCSSWTGLAEALPFAREAVRLWRRVTESAADDRRYRAGLAVSLHTLGELLAKLDRPAEALPYAQEAVDLHRACVGLLGDHRLAGSLRTLGDVLTALDRPAEARAARDEATALGDTEGQTEGQTKGDTEGETKGGAEGEAKPETP